MARRIPPRKVRYFEPVAPHRAGMRKGGRSRPLVLCAVEELKFA
jgi:hypothetical protein